MFLCFSLVASSAWAMPKIAIFFTDRAPLAEEDIENVKKVIHKSLYELGATFELVPIEEVAFRFDDEYEFPESQFRQKRFIIRIFARLRLDSLIVAKLVTESGTMICKLKFINKREMERLDFDRAKEYPQVSAEGSLTLTEFFKPLLEKILTEKNAGGIHLASIDRSQEGKPKPTREFFKPRETIFGKNLT